MACCRWCIAPAFVGGKDRTDIRRIPDLAAAVLYQGNGSKNNFMAQIEQRRKNSDTARVVVIQENCGNELLVANFNRFAGNGFVITLAILVHSNKPGAPAIVRFCLGILTSLISSTKSFKFAPVAGFTNPQLKVFRQVILACAILQN